MNKIKFGKNVKKLREGACLTQQQLAFNAGLAVATVSRIENGSGASLSTITYLAEALQVSTKTLKGE